MAKLLVLNTRNLGVMMRGMGRESLVLQGFATPADTALNILSDNITIKWHMSREVGHVELKLKLA